MGLVFASIGFYKQDSQQILPSDRKIGNIINEYDNCNIFYVNIFAARYFLGPQNKI